MIRVINNVQCKVVDDEWDVYFDMALTMLEEIIDHNQKCEKTVLIVPVGPTRQYPILAEMVNRLGVSLQNVHFFNMDEYMTSPSDVLSEKDPMSFHGRMKRDFYDRVRPELVMPEQLRHFPMPGHEAEYDQLIADLGGVDMVFGGLGINGHIAFNEAAEADDPITADEFANLGTRVLPITRETRTINAYGYQRGDLRGMPEWCITVGMKQILSAKKIYIALNRPWQNGPFKHALMDREQGQIPATLLRRCANLTYCASREIAEGTVE
ncbi:MAG: glucosamine-6-phosphate isomerase [Eubacteriales bacterium]|nr:glucosamine-6-phosphate isomerase [Eubacteriales bacterium]